MNFWNRKTGTVLVNLALLVISSGITILGADLMLRFFVGKSSYYRPHDMSLDRWPELPLVSRYKKDIDYSGKIYGDLAAHLIGEEYPGEKRHLALKTDSFGFRNSEEPRNHEPYDLIVLGDSFGAGTGTTQDRTWVALLQGRYGLKAYNLSIPGASPWAHYVYLATEIKRLPVHPKSIVLLTIFSGNDLDDYYYGRDVELSDLPWSSTAKKIGVRFKNFVRRSPIRKLVNKLRYGDTWSRRVLVRDFVDGRKILFDKFYVTTTQRTKAMIENHSNYDKLLDATRKIKQIVDEHNLALVILLFPSKEEVYEWVLEGSPPWTTDIRPSGLSKAMSNFCGQSNLSFYDLKPSLVEASEKEIKESGEPIWWHDDTHLNEIGNGIVADIVYRTLFTSSSIASNKGMHTDGGSAERHPRR